MSEETTIIEEPVLEEETNTAFELDKTVKIGTTTYNINAVTADKVANKLKLKVIGLGGTECTRRTVEYDGLDEKSIDLVTAAGGKFNGEIRVPNNTNPHDLAVLNYSDITNNVLKQIINNSTLGTWTWDASTNNGELSFTEGTGNIKGITIIKGSSDTFESFQVYNAGNYRIESYLFVCADTNEIYLCILHYDSDKDIYSTETLSLAVNANTANTANEAEKAATALKIIDNNSIEKFFDYKALDTLWQAIYANTHNQGETKAGILQTLDAAVETNKTQNTNIEALQKWRDAVKSTKAGYVSKAESADSASKATSDSAGNNISTSYYHSDNPENSPQSNTIKILSSSEVGSAGGIENINGVRGDILIVY